MSIASEITRLQSAKNTLKTKLNAKNDNEHQISNETIDQYGNFVDSIPVGKLTNAEYTEADNDVDDILENTTVPSGTISITANGEYDVTNYTDANVNVVSENNASVLTTGMNGTAVYVLITKLPIIDTSQMTSFNSFFSYLYNLQEVPLIDTSNATILQGMCRDCKEIKTIPNFNTSNVTSFNSTFSGCIKLENVPVLNTSKNTVFTNMFYNCISLTNDSLNNILAMCAGATSYTGTKTLATLGLSRTQATTCTGLSNWASAQSAGWTTGY